LTASKCPAAENRHYPRDADRISLAYAEKGVIGHFDFSGAGSGTNGSFDPAVVRFPNFLPSFQGSQDRFYFITQVNHCWVEVKAKWL
jgi:hypothetical protein